MLPAGWATKSMPLVAMMVQTTLQPTVIDNTTNSWNDLNQALKCWKSEAPLPTLQSLVEI